MSAFNRHQYSRQPKATRSYDVQSDEDDEDLKQEKEKLEPVNLKETLNISDKPKRIPVDIKTRGHNSDVIVNKPPSFEYWTNTEACSYKGTNLFESAKEDNLFHSSMNNIHKLEDLLFHGENAIAEYRVYKNYREMADVYVFLFQTCQKNNLPFKAYEYGYGACKCFLEFNPEWAQQMFLLLADTCIQYQKQYNNNDQVFMIKAAYLYKEFADFALLKHQFIIAFDFFTKAYDTFKKISTNTLNSSIKSDMVKCCSLVADSICLSPMIPLQSLIKARCMYSEAFLLDDSSLIFGLKLLVCDMLIHKSKDLDVKNNEFEDEYSHKTTKHMFYTKIQEAFDAYIEDDQDIIEDVIKYFVKFNSEDQQIIQECKWFELMLCQIQRIMKNNTDF